MTEQTSTPSTLKKSLSIIVFIAVLAGAAWVSVQVVHVAPGAIRSLASIAETVTSAPDAVIVSTLPDDNAGADSASTTAATTPTQIASAIAAITDLPDTGLRTEPDTAAAIATPEQPAVFTPHVSGVDLSTSFIGVGEIIDGAFIPGIISVYNAGAMQFTVQNIGDTVSNTWTYRLTLPDDTTYTSPSQASLAPGEITILTVGFPASLVTQHTFAVDISTDTDSNSRNNSFASTVDFVQ